MNSWWSADAFKKKIGFRSTGICTCIKVFIYLWAKPLCNISPFSSLVWGSPCLLNGEIIFDCIAWDMSFPAMVLITILWMRIFISLPDMLPTLRYDDFFFLLLFLQCYQPLDVRICFFPLNELFNLIFWNSLLKH